MVRLPGDLEAGQSDTGLIIHASGKYFLDSSSVPAQDQHLPGEVDVNSTMTTQAGM